MIEIALLVVFVIMVAAKPIMVPYLMLIFIFVQGLLGANYLDTFKVTFGHINVYSMDLLYLVTGIFFVIFCIKNTVNLQFKKNQAIETRSMIRVVLLFVCFYVAKLLHGFLEGMPFDSLLRLFMGDTSILYFFMPLVIVKNTKQLKSLLKYAVFLALLFPLFQPLLINSAATRDMMLLQGTFRLGYGDANVLLAMGVLALFSWSYKKYLSFLPVAGIMMLAHRSGYIAFALSYIILSFLKGEKLKSVVMLILAGILTLAMMLAIESFTSVNVLQKNISRAGETFQNTGTTKARLGVIPIIAEEFQLRPFTGLSYAEFYDKTIRINARNFDITHPHNFILATIVNTGLIGLVLKLTLLGKSLRAAHTLSRDNALSQAGAFLFSWLCFFIVYATMNTTLESAGYLFWFGCGTVFCLCNQVSKSKEAG